ncbi:MAG TPA: hypothetical protein VJJ52_05590 [Candidatus Nanoarchaeia archaeon]|nr:hypothetical protein [Candidatus Nanoarchaeia archaeon]
MRINKTAVVIGILLTLILAFTAASQISFSDIPLPDNHFKNSKISVVNEKLSVEEKQDCEITYFNQSEPIYGNVTRIRDVYVPCVDPINLSNSTCVNGTESYQSYEQVGAGIFLRNTTKCTSGSFVVSVSKNGNTEKKEIDFSSWGVCVQEKENDCIAVLCGNLEGGSARNGIFNGCDGGKSCEKFLFCEDGVKVFYKAARENFVEHDPTFKLDKLAYKEVSK